MKSKHPPLPCLRNHDGSFRPTTVWIALPAVLLCSCALPQASMLTSRSTPAGITSTQTQVSQTTANTTVQAKTHVARRLPPATPQQPATTALVAHQSPAAPQPAQPIVPRDQVQLVNPTLAAVPAEPVPAPVATEAVPENAFIVDLATALRLGGARSLQVRLARERTLQACLEWKLARAAVLPSIWYGVGWNRHNGRIQATEGDVIEAGRNSLFLGGGAGLDGASTAGGSGGPSRLVVNLSLADAHFQPLVARQLLEAADAAEQRDINNSLLEIATAYFNVLEARSRLANVRQGLAAAEDMVQKTTDFFEAGKLAESETYRATTERAFWQRNVQDAQRLVVRKTTELARLLRLSFNTELMPADDQLYPVQLVDESLSLEQLVASGLSARPELVRHDALVQARIQQLRQEYARPWLPYVQLGASGGSFGGGQSSNFDNQGSRSDVDVLAVWELRNMGMGNLLSQRRRASQLEQSELEVEMLEDRVVTDIVSAAADVASYRQQMQSARQGVEAAHQSYDANVERILDAVGLPIELVQAIRARADAQNAYTQAISDYNRAQYALLRALGEPAAAAGP